MAVALAGLAGALLLVAAAAAQPAADLASLASQARRLMSEGKFSAAAGIYARLERAVPNEPGLAMNHGMALHMAGRHEEAIPKLRTALQFLPGTGPALFMLGASYLSLGRVQEALAPLREAGDAGVPEARPALAQAYASLARHAEAGELFRSWTAADPRNPAAWYGLGTSYAALAQAALEALAREAPESGYMVALAAEVQLSQERYASAARLFREALNRQPDLPGAHLGLAEAYRGSGRAEQAAAERSREPAITEAACAARPEPCLFRQGRFLELVETARARSGPAAPFWQSRAYEALANEAFGRLGELPPSPESHASAAQGFRDRGRYREAIEEWRAALRLRPGDAGFERGLAIALQLNRDYAAARPLLERLVAHEPRSAELNYSLGSVLLNMQQPQAAIERLLVVAEIEPGFLPARASLGLAYLQIGQHEAAARHLEAALPTDVDGSLHFRLAQAYQRTGKAERARNLLERYQEIKRRAAEEQTLDRDIGLPPP